MDSIINILYQDYLLKSKLDEEKMHPVQRVETKRAFVAGITSTLALQAEKVEELTESDAAKLLDQIWQESVNFWNKQS